MAIWGEHRAVSRRHSMLYSTSGHLQTDLSEKIGSTVYDLVRRTWNRYVSSGLDIWSRRAGLDHLKAIFQF